MKKIIIGDIYLMETNNSDPDIMNNEAYILP